MLRKWLRHAEETSDAEDVAAAKRGSKTRRRHVCGCLS